MKYFIIDEEQVRTLTAMSRRLYTEVRLDGDQMRDFAHILDLITASCQEMPAYPGGLPKEKTMRD